MKKTQFSFLLSGDQIYFDFLSFTAHQKRIGKVEKVTFWANPGTVCIYQSFILRFCDERASFVNPHLTIVTLNCLVFFQNGTAAKSTVCSLCNTKIHFLIPISTVHCLQVWRMMRESAFHSPRIRRPYPMPCNFFLQRRHWNLGPGFISISPARMRRAIKLVPFEGLKLIIPQNFCGFQGSYYMPNTEILRWWNFCNQSYIPDLSQYIQPVWCIVFLVCFFRGFLIYTNWCTLLKHFASDVCVDPILPIFSCEPGHFQTI